MPGPRMTTDALKERGKKHLSQNEEAERRAGEVQVETAKTAEPPKWLPKPLRKEFCDLGGRLITAGIYTDLDADTLGRYLVAHDNWGKASKEVKKALKGKEPEIEKVDAWSKIQERYFKQARACANDIGLTVTSRCRLVVPQSTGQPTEDDNPFLKLIQGGKAANG